jgi:hypothetical protein
MQRGILQRKSRRFSVLMQSQGELRYVATRPAVLKWPLFTTDKGRVRKKIFLALI